MAPVAHPDLEPPAAPQDAAGEITKLLAVAPKPGDPAADPHGGNVEAAQVEVEAAERLGGERPDPGHRREAIL